MNKETAITNSKVSDITSRSPADLILWQEALGQLRQLHSDVWNGIRFFLTVNGVIFAAILALNTSTGGTNKSVATYLPFLGILVTIATFQIFKKHRRSYVEMLLRKTLIENELQFYKTKIEGVDLSFPWKVDQEYLNDLKKDPDKWVEEQMFRSGTATFWLRLFYYLVAFIHMIFLVPLAKEVLSLILR